MHAGILGHVLVHHVGHHVHRLNAIKGGAATFRRAGGVGRDAPEAELG